MSMSYQPNPLAMMKAHVHLNMGVYFDHMAEDGGVTTVTSRTIPDTFWNFAFASDGGVLDEMHLGVARAALEKAGRGLAVWQPADGTMPSGWVVQSQEAWMWLDEVHWNSRDERRPAGSRIEVREIDLPTQDMRSVFEDAYSSPGKAGDVGYFELPREYGDAYAMGRATAPCVMRHFAGFLDGKCVVVGAAAVWNGIGGLYSVATLHGHRRQGFGSELSRVATAWAFANGAQGVLLQTAADSEVEALYSTLGYRRSHIGLLLTQSP